VTGIDYDASCTGISARPDPWPRLETHTVRYIAESMTHAQNVFISAQSYEFLSW